MRDENILESALAQRRQKWHYGGPVDWPALAAADAFGLVRNHPYFDGNKRAGFLAMVTFLELNGQDFEATDAEVVDEIVALADGSVTEAELTSWIRHRMTKPRSA